MTLARRILIVDNEPHIEPLCTQRFRRELRKGLVQLHFAFDAEQAIEALTQPPTFDIVVILSDINLPGISGLELLEFVKGAQPNMPVFLLNEQADRADAARALGVAGLIDKPLDFSAFKSLILATAVRLPMVEGGHERPKRSTIRRSIGMRRLKKRKRGAFATTQELRDLRLRMEQNRIKRDTARHSMQMVREAFDTPIDQPASAAPAAVIRAASAADPSPASIPATHTSGTADSSDEEAGELVEEQAAVVLVVDDETDVERLIRQKFRRRIRSGELLFHFAHNGAEGLELVQQTPEIEMVLSDINMPVMDGITMVEKIHAIKPKIKCVIVSAYGDMRNIRAAMNRGAFDFLTKPIQFDDLAITMDKTLDVVRTEKERDRAMRDNEILRMYVDDSVLSYHKVEDAQLRQGGIKVEGTVCFIDICGFTTLCETHEPGRVFALLNHYFDEIVAEITAANGWVDKFVGDAVMAVFRGEHHRLRAVEAALRARTRIQNIQTATQEDFGFSPNVSIGLHSGEMVAGNLGSSNLNRYDFSVIGDAVNTAARLESKAKAGEILISAPVANVVGCRYYLVEKGPLPLKGKREPMPTFNVLTTRD